MNVTLIAIIYLEYAKHTFCVDGHAAKKKK